ncbi:MAG: serine protein kinase RIO [Methanophagales archaeon ANME-1-THS]|nr:MAG: serine protein kinase RIO [Methanophagales archaeon ANME-1-THS]
MAEKEGLFEIEKWVSERQLPKGKRRKKDYRDRKTEQYVFDIPTLETLYKFSKKGIIKALGGPVSQGKESVIFHAIGGEDEELAIKMYKINTAHFNAMIDYISGDPRFEPLRKDRRSVIYTWAQKEYKNLKRATEAGVRVPRPIACDKNVLIMEFIGKEGIAAPRLHDLPADMLKADVELEELFLRLISAIKTLYEKGMLVHADLSEFNIVMKGYVERELQTRAPAGAEIALEPVLIDMGQSLLVSHPHAERYLKRDVQNLTVFFRKHGLAYSEEEVMQMIQGAERAAESSQRAYRGLGKG